MSSAEDCSTLSRNAMDYKTKLNALSASGNLRHISSVRHDGRWIWDGTHRMLNLSSNDYLGLASEPALVSEFLDTCPQSSRIFSSSSSRLLTGNFELAFQQWLSRKYGNPSRLGRKRLPHFGRQVSSCQHYRWNEAFACAFPPLPASRYGAA